MFAAGSVLEKIRAMVDEHGNRIKEAGPSFPVEALGFGIPTVEMNLKSILTKKLLELLSEIELVDARATKLAQQMASRRVSLSSLSNHK